MTRSGISVGMNKGHVAEPMVQKPKPSRKKGSASQKAKFVRSLIREVVGFSPYELRVMELLRLNKDRHALRYAKKRLGTHRRAVAKRVEMQDVLRNMKKNKA
ncbi:hypothetical protein PCE1_002637 [Barthelona sp. PCE]